MKMMIDCLTTNSLCMKVQGNYNRLKEVGNQLQSGGITPAKRKQLLAEKSELSKALGETCHMCESIQRIKIAITKLKVAYRALLAANEALEEAEADTEGVAIAVYERLIAKNPELETVFEIGDVVFEYALESEADWIDHCDLIGNLEDEVLGATKALNEVAALLDKLIDEL